MKEKIEKILNLCNAFVDDSTIPEESKDQMVIDVVETVFGKSVYAIEVEVLQEIFESLDYLPDEENVHTNF